MRCAAWELVSANLCRLSERLNTLARPSRNRGCDCCGDQQAPVVCCMTRTRSSSENGFRIVGNPPRRRSRPDTWRTFNAGCRRVARSANSWPSMLGISMSVIRIEIESSRCSSSRASEPLLAQITWQPISSSMVAITSRTPASSSTRSIVCVIRNKQPKPLAVPARRDRRRERRAWLPVHCCSRLKSRRWSRGILGLEGSTLASLIRCPVFRLIWLKLILQESNVAGYQAAGQVTFPFGPGGHSKYSSRYTTRNSRRTNRARWCDRYFAYFPESCGVRSG
jgi:hypothetical protein